MSVKSPKVFPLTDDVAPHIDGLIFSSPADGHFMSALGPAEPVALVKNRGSIIKGNIGNTDYIDTNTTWHAVLAGDF